VLGNPKIADASSLPTIRDAVLWLRDAACKHLPESDFGRKYGGFVSAATSLCTAVITSTFRTP
jgi:hypothetical protein